MIFSNLHTHTTFSDGKNSPEEMIGRAKELSFTSLGFSDHSEALHPSFSYPVKSDINDYRKAILDLKERLADEITIFCGVEMDSYAHLDGEKFDYVIGSVHYISAFDSLFPIDRSREDQLSFIERYGRGEPLELARRYYDRLVTFAQKEEFDILGHFDLVNKFSLFQEDDPEYSKIATEALAEVAKCVPFIELNTGAISRGYRSVPYPAPAFLPTLKNIGGKVVVGSDAHNVEGLDCHFNKVPDILRENGFQSFYVKKTNCFEEIPLK